MLKQISAFIENKPGRLSEVTGYLAGADINIHAMSIADTTDFGILRMIVSDPYKAKDILKGNGLTVKTTDVVAIAMDHTPGSLHKVLLTLEDMKINVDYMYAFTSRPVDDAMVILRLENQDEALGKLKNSGIKLLGSELLDRLNEMNRA